MVDKCRAFGRGIVDKARPFWLSLLGKSGTGKTHCAERLWKLGERLDWNRCAYIPGFIYWPSFVVRLREQTREGTGMANVLDMGKWPLLVLDDIGAERDKTGFAAEHLNLILGARVGKWTLITSNLTLPELSTLDDRIASRIVREPGNLWIELSTTDYGLRHRPA